MNEFLADPEVGAILASAEKLEVNFGLGSSVQYRSREEGIGGDVQIVVRNVSGGGSKPQSPRGDKTSPFPFRNMPT